MSLARYVLLSSSIDRVCFGVNGVPLSLGSGIPSEVVVFRDFLYFF